MSTKYYNGTIQKGSQGENTSEWQRFLQSQGYGLTVDGIFGDETDKYTRDYQSKNGLAVDGIVGENTWAKAGYSNLNTPVSAPTTSPFDKTLTQDTTSYLDSTTGQATSDAVDKANQALNAHDPFTFSEDNWLKDVKDRIKNFSYDVNTDALYQQYKDQYVRQGKLAMADTMGQAAALTGGYGNSYAQTAGQQTFQGYLQQLNDIVPELAQMSKDNLYDEYGFLLSEYDREKAVDTEKYNRLLEAYRLASDNHFNNANMFYSDQSNKNSAAYNEYNAGLSAWEANNANAWNETEWKEYVRKTILGGSTEDSYYVGENPVTDEQTGKTYDNGGYREDIVKQAQEFLGASADGLWGIESAAAASKKGYNSIADVVAAMRGGGFTGQTYDDAYYYAKQNGVPNSAASNIMTSQEWSRRKQSYKSTGQGDASVSRFDTYQEYLASITEYLIDQYAK